MWRVKEVTVESRSESQFDLKWCKIITERTTTVYVTGETKDALVCFCVMKTSMFTVVFKNSWFYAECFSQFLQEQIKVKLWC